MAYKTSGLSGPNSLHFEFSSCSHFQLFLDGGGRPSPWVQCSCSSSCYVLVGQRAVQTDVPDPPVTLQAQGALSTDQYWILQAHFQTANKRLFNYLSRD